MSSYIAVDPDKCIGCKTCEQHVRTAIARLGCSGAID